MASVNSRSNTSQERINFVMRPVKYNLGITQWAQDESRCSRTASLTGIADSKEYKALLGTALEYATLRKVKSNQADTNSKAYDPGKLKYERTRTKWKVKIKNYLSTIPGVKGVSLSYAVQSQVAPGRIIDFQGEFIADNIACAT